MKKNKNPDLFSASKEIVLDYRILYNILPKIDTRVVFFNSYKMNFEYLFIIDIVYKESPHRFRLEHIDHWKHICFEQKNVTDMQKVFDLCVIQNSEKIRRLLC